MNNIIRFWNRNRGMIIFGVVAIAFLIIIVHILNGFAKDKNKNKQQNIVVLTEEEKTLPTKSIYGEEDVTIEKTKDNVSVINEFIEKCNNKQIQEAYDMLTDDCKTEIYDSLEYFETGYVNPIFETKKIADIKLVGEKNKRYTYSVDIYTDMLSTGIADNAYEIKDYITVDETSENGQINLNGFIYKTEINSTEEKDGVKITVLSKSIYYEDEKYEVKIENNTDKDILMNTGKRTNTITLIDNKGIVHDSDVSTFASVKYRIKANNYRKYTFTFKKYSTSNVLDKALIFADIVLDAEKYEQTEDSENERINLTINI